MTRRSIVFIVPARIAQPLCWRGEPGWFGATKYTAKFTDGSWRRVSRHQIMDNALD